MPLRLNFFSVTPPHVSGVAVTESATFFFSTELERTRLPYPVASWLSASVADACCHSSSTLFNRIHVHHTSPLNDWLLALFGSRLESFLSTFFTLVSLLHLIRLLLFLELLCLFRFPFSSSWICHLVDLKSEWMKKSAIVNGTDQSWTVSCGVYHAIWMSDDDHKSAIWSGTRCWTKTATKITKTGATYLQLSSNLRGMRRVRQLHAGFYLAAYS